MREDKDLKFLEKCSHDDLKTLANILIYGKDNKNRWTEDLSKYENDKDWAKNWHKIARELQLFGGDSIANLSRGITESLIAWFKKSKTTEDNKTSYKIGITYREIVEDVCKIQGVKFDKTKTTEELEELLLLSILNKSIEKLDNDKREELLKNLNIETTGFSTEAIITAVKTGLYVKSVMFPTTLFSMIGTSIIEAFTGKGLLTIAGETLGGPIAWAIGIGFTAKQISGPAFRVTTPAVIEVAILRRKCLAKKKEKKKIFYKLFNWFKNDK